MDNLVVDKIEDKDELAQAYLKKISPLGAPLTEEQSRAFRNFLAKIGAVPVTSSSSMLKEFEALEPKP